MIGCFCVVFIQIMLGDKLSGDKFKSRHVLAGFAPSDQKHRSLWLKRFCDDPRRPPPRAKLDTFICSRNIRSEACRRPLISSAPPYLQSHSFADGGQLMRWTCDKRIEGPLTRLLTGSGVECIGRSSFDSVSGPPLNAPTPLIPLESPTLCRRVYQNV